MEKDQKTEKENQEQPEQKLSLSQDDFERQNAEIERLKSELGETREEVKRRRVDDRIDELKAMGLSQWPGLLAEVRNVMLSDDGGAALLLSEEKDGETAASKLTVTDVVERFIGALPTEDGKIVLSEQASTLSPEKEDEQRPPANEDTKSEEDRAKDARDFLYG